MPSPTRSARAHRTQLNQADSRSLRSLRKQLRIKSKQSQFLLRAANKRHVLLCFEAASKPMPARSQRYRTNPQVWCLKSSKIDETKSEKASRKRSSARRKLQAFSRRLTHTQLQQKPKVACKNRNAEEREQAAQVRKLLQRRESAIMALARGLRCFPPLPAAYANVPNSCGLPMTGRAKELAS